MSTNLRTIVAWMAPLALLLILATVTSRLWFGGGPYPYDYLMLDPADTPIRIDLDASRRLIEGHVHAEQVRSARYTNRWPEGYTGWGRGLEAPGFPATELTRLEIERLLAILDRDLLPIPAQDREQDGFMNSQGQVMVRLTDGAKAMVSVGRGVPPHLLISSPAGDPRYNTSARPLFSALRARARVSPHVPLLFPDLDTAGEDTLAKDKLGGVYLDVKQFVATRSEFEAELGTLRGLRIARGRNFTDPDVEPPTAMFTFSIQGEHGRGVVQAMAYRNGVRAELIVTEHRAATAVGRFITATGARPNRQQPPARDD